METQTKTNGKSFGELAFNAYRKSMAYYPPMWKDLPDKEKSAWELAAKAVITEKETRDDY